MDKVLITTIGAILIGFIYWFFFGKKEEGVVANGDLNVLVNGGYNPSVIKLKKGQSTILKVQRKDPNSCLEELIIPDFKIKKYLPLNQTIEIEINPDKKGEFPFHCGMNMFHGKILVQ